MSQDIVLVAPVRTPVGGFMGGLSNLTAVDLGKIVLGEALRRSGLDAGMVDEVILGQVLTAGAGQNTARQAAVAAGIPVERAAITINQVCGSGLRAVALAANSIRSGEATIVLAGGQESMSQSPHCAVLRSGIRMGNASLIDTMIQDGLWDIFNNYHMGITAENVAKEYNITREEQDALALASQAKAEVAQKAGYFKDEIVPVFIKGKKGDVTIDTDEHPRHGTTADALTKLKPAFDKTGTVTAGNASGINDGAAVVLVTTATEAAKRNLKPIARIASFATAGVAPSIMGTGPIPASKKALERAGWKVADLDLIEANEAFAAQACAVNKALGFDLNRVNVNGGAIALGHPIGASGCRVLVTLLHELKRRGGKRGLATLCVGGGMGVALCVEAL